MGIKWRAAHREHEGRRWFCSLLYTLTAHIVQVQQGSRKSKGKYSVKGVFPWNGMKFLQSLDTSIIWVLGVSFSKGFIYLTLPRWSYHHGRWTDLPAPSRGGSWWPVHRLQTQRCGPHDKTSGAKGPSTGVWVILMTFYTWTMNTECIFCFLICPLTLRVVLGKDGGYINANFIKMPVKDENFLYMACQGPLPTTPGDF